MPNPVSQAQTVAAINQVLPTMNPPGAPIQNLDTAAMSDPNWSCNNFSPAVLEAVCNLVGVDPSDLQSIAYQVGAQNLPDEFADQSFVNISMMGEPSSLNHNFNILVSGGTTYLIQAFEGQAVNIVRQFANATFITEWQNLSNNVNWTASYQALFGVAPVVVTPNPPVNTWLQSQYVTQ
jgi:hypothetical protein